MVGFGGYIDLDLVVMCGWNWWLCLVRSIDNVWLDLVLCVTGFSAYVWFDLLIMCDWIWWLSVVGLGGYVCFELVVMSGRM